MKSVEEKIKELKEEILGKELTLLEVDNKAMRILESSTSIFGYEEREIIEMGGISYLIQKHDMWDSGTQDVYVNVVLKLIEENENTLEINVKVCDIYEI